MVSVIAATDPHAVYWGKIKGILLFWHTTKPQSI